MQVPTSNTQVNIMPKRILAPDIRTIKAIHDMIMNNLAAPMPTIETLAKKACMSPSKFRGLFQEIYKFSIYQYHLNARMALAKELLLSNEYTVTQISYKVGFSHHQSFIKTFMKHSGCSPRQFQLNSLQKNIDVL